MARHEEMSEEAKTARESLKIFLIIIGVSSFAFAIVMAGLVGYYATVDATSPETTTTKTPSVTSAPTKPVTTTTSEGSGVVSPDSIYHIGVARTDVTGPIVQVNMMGYAHPEQVANGLHTRLYSRAYVIADQQKETRVAFVSIDGGMTSQLLKLEVVKRLQEKHGDLFTEKNVVISGSHTHSGPAGFFQFMLFEVTSLGHVEQSTQAFVDGIVESIEQANANMKEGTIKIGRGNVVEGNINRSPTSYLLNPENEREKYTADTEQEMTLLKMESTTGAPIGMVSWYPVHLTSMNFSNLLINSDNKGRASSLFEKRMRKEGETVGGQESFVGVFAQANLGDVSPRTKGPICIDTGRECDAETSTCGRGPRPDPTKCVGFGPGKDMFDSTDIIGRRQLETAVGLFDEAAELLEGSVSWVHQYVNMSNVELNDGSNRKTCPPGLGYSFAAGCTDGAGPPIFTQGTTQGKEPWETIRDVIIQLVGTMQPNDDYYECHKPKPVLLPTAYMDKPWDWHPSVVDVQMLKIGQLIIIAVPGEFSTMAGRRLRETVRQRALAEGMPENTKVVIAGLSNVYTHYMTTSEEFAAQRYEAASTIFGPHTTDAYLQQYDALVPHLVADTPELVEPGPSPEYRPMNQSQFAPIPGPDSVPEGVNFGDVIDDANLTYVAGDTVRVKFYGANPRHNMKLGSTYLEVQQRSGLQWQTVFTDADWETKFTWLEKNTTVKDNTLFDVLFETIAHVSEQKFDWKLALDLYEKDAFPSKEEIEKLGVLEAFARKGVLRREARPTPIDPFLEAAVESYVTIEWTIPEQTTGTFRIIYFGDHMTADGTITPFQGQTREFTVSESKDSV